MDIEKLTQDTMAKMTEEKLPGIVEKYVTELLDNTVKEMFGWNSDFQKKLKGSLQEKLNISLDGMELKDYNELVCNKITNLVTKNYIDTETSNIEECITEALGEPFSEKVFLSEIVEKFKSFVIKDSCSDEESGEISFHCDHNNEHNWTTVGLDARPDISLADCRYQLMFSHRNNNSLFSVKMQAEFCRDKPLSAFKMNHYNSWQTFIIRLKNSRNIKIELDDNSIDTEWFKYGEDY